MVINRHIGTSHLKWVAYATFCAIFFLFIFDLIFYGLLGHFSSNLIIDEKPLSARTIQSLYRHQWKVLLWPVIIFLVLGLLKESILGFSKNQKHELITYQNINKIGIGVFLIFALYFTIYKAGFSGYIEAIQTMLKQSDYNKKAVDPYKTIYIILFAISIFKIYIALSIVKIITSIHDVILGIQENSFIKRLFSYGKGDNSEWASIVDLQKSRVTTDGADIILGRSMFEDDYDPSLTGISQDNDGHIVTIGMTGSGKSSAVLLPNLTLYEGSIFVFDPKGGLAKQTFERRNTSSMFNMYSFLLDPFEETKGELPYTTFNPLSMIDMEDPKKSSYVDLITDACIIISPDASDVELHFAQLSKNLIKGLIIHVLSIYPKENHNLPFVFDLLSEGVEDESNQTMDVLDNLIVEMHLNNAYGGLVQKMASLLDRMGDKEKGSVMTTTYRALFWTSTPAMRKHLTKNSNINFLSLSYKTVYYVLPTDKIGENKIWVRMLANLFIKHEMDIPVKNTKRTLFIMDEYFKLGGIKSVSDNFSYLREYRIRLWIVFQTISQLKATVGKTWNDVLGASTIQILGVKEDETAQWTSKNLGKRRSQIREKEGRILEQDVPVLSPNQVKEEFQQRGDLLLVFPMKGRPQRLYRINFKSLEFGTSYECLYPPVSLKGKIKNY